MCLLGGAQEAAKEAARVRAEQEAKRAQYEAEQVGGAQDQYVIMWGSACFGAQMKCQAGAVRGRAGGWCSGPIC